MADDFTELLKINDLKRSHAEAKLNQVLSKVRALEAQQNAIQAKLQDAKDKMTSDTNHSELSESFLPVSLSDMGVFEQWELAQIAKLKTLSEKIRALDPELAEVKAALKTLIVREDTLSALAKTARTERRQAFDDKTAEATQALWLTTLRKKGRA